MAASVPRTVLRRAVERAHMEGGASIRRPIGPHPLAEFMPFLLLDDLETKGKQNGFGDHPHRGQETMTYVLEGKLVHQDSKGNEGTLQPGDLQAMRAGRGIVHSEVPVEDPETHGTKGIQLWVALPEKNLNDNPGYTDVVSASCPVAVPFPGVRIKIIAGESFGKKARILTRASVWYLDITLDRGGKVKHPIPGDFNAFVLVLEGTPEVAGSSPAAQPHEIFLFNRDGQFVELENKNNRQARVLLIAGDPLEGQDIHRYGPFVSNSSAGINKAISDYRMQKNGFEGTHGWKSKPVHN